MSRGGVLRHADSLAAAAVDSVGDATLGYIPAAVASWLSPLIDSCGVMAKAR